MPVTALKHKPEVIIPERPKSRYTLEYLLANPETDYIGRFLIGVDEATRLLEFNGQNRDLRQKHVTHLANEMREGRFEGLNGSLLVVTFKGDVIDGQHRLWAIMECGIPQIVEVKFGADPKVFMTVNQSKPQTAADILRYKSVADPKQVQTICSALIRFDRRNFGGSIAPGEVARFAEGENKEKLAAAVAMLKRMKKRPLGSPAVLAAIYMRALQVSTADANEFFGNIVDLKFSSDMDPAKALYTMLSSPTKSYGQSGQDTIAVGTVKAWNAWRQDKKMKLLRVGPEERIEALI